MTKNQNESIFSNSKRHDSLSTEKCELGSSELHIFLCTSGSHNVLAPILLSEVNTIGLLQIEI